MSPVYQLNDDLVFPSPKYAGPDGLLAIGGDLRVERVLLAYRHGIFPWYSEGDPILWWSPDPRLILAPEEFRMSRSLRRVVRVKTFSVTMDTAFVDVLEACAAIRGRGREGTWITPEMAAAYCRLHALGYAHSVECWQGSDLAGGLYGVSLGKAFFGESMFARVSNASKVALAALAARLNEWDFDFIDCQLPTRHLMSLGAREISRPQFLRRLAHALRGETRRGKWPSNTHADKAAVDPTAEVHYS